MKRFSNRVIFDLLKSNISINFAWAVRYVEFVDILIKLSL